MKIIKESINWCPFNPEDLNKFTFRFNSDWIYDNIINKAVDIFSAKIGECFDYGYDYGHNQYSFRYEDPEIDKDDPENEALFRESSYLGEVVFNAISTAISNSNNANDAARAFSDWMIENIPKDSKHYRHSFPLSYNIPATHWMGKEF